MQTPFSNLKFKNSLLFPQETFDSRPGYTSDAVPSYLLEDEPIILPEIKRQRRSTVSTINSNITKYNIKNILNMDTNSCKAFEKIVDPQNAGTHAVAIIRSGSHFSFYDQNTDPYFFKKDITDWNKNYKNKFTFSYDQTQTVKNINQERSCLKYASKLEREFRTMPKGGFDNLLSQIN